MGEDDPNKAIVSLGIRYMSIKGIIQFVPDRPW